MTVCYEILQQSHINDACHPAKIFVPSICVMWSSFARLLTTGRDCALLAMNWAIKRSPRYEWAHLISVPSGHSYLQSAESNHRSKGLRETAFSADITQPSSAS